jgi:carbon storage regulator
MLILGRKSNQKIIINENIIIHIVEVRGDRVRLGIDAPKETSVDREEIYQRKKKDVK